MPSLDIALGDQMLKRVLPWALIFAVILVVLQIAVEHTPEETGTGLWKWRYVAIIVAVVLGFPAACAWCYDRGKAKGIASVPVAITTAPTAEQEARVASAHTWASIEQLQYMVREIATNVLKPDHINAERASVELGKLERRHHVWYNESAHATREQFAGVVKGILHVRRNNGRQGIYSSLNDGEYESWNSRLVSVRGNLLDVLAESKEA